MSGLSMLFTASLDYERTHQIVLKTLFDKANFAKYLIDFDSVINVEWEPERQLFDLALTNSENKAYIEIKKSCI